MDRRQFVLTSAAAVAAGRLQHTMSSDAGSIGNIGVQLFSLPKLLERDLRGGIAMLSRIGYREVQLFGPFPFSAPSAQASWNALSGMLGFSGSGYFGQTPAQFRVMMNEHRISVPAIHTDLETLETRMGALAEAGRQIGFTYVGLPAIPDDRRRTLDDYKRMAESFNRIGAEAKRHGLKFAYHNHGYGWKEMGGTVPMRMVLEQTDPELVLLEMDLFWTTAAGMDPVELLRTYPKRYHLMHVKDMREQRRFSGDGGDAQQWMALFPYMSPSGAGVMNTPAIIAAAKASGVKHFFVEQDLVADPETALKQSFDYLNRL